MSDANTIHPTAVVDGNTKLGKGNYIGPFCIIGPNVEIGDNNRFEANVCIGTAAEHRDFFHLAPGKVKIGNNNVLREFVTVNGGTEEVTTLMNDVVMLRGSHIGHDAVIGNKVNLSCNVMVGGHTIIDEFANLGLSSTVHQHRVIGAFAMIGMNSTVTRSILPFTISFGSPAESHKINKIGLTRFGLSVEEVSQIDDWFFNVKGQEQAEPSLLGTDFDKYIKYYNSMKKKYS